MMKTLTYSIMLLALVFPVQASAAAKTVKMDRIEADTVWSGEVLVEKPLTVSREASLTIKPGTTVRFKKGAGLTVEGVLKARGTASAPVRFASAEKEAARGDWAGIGFNVSGEGSLMEHCRVEGAAALSITACSPAIRDCEFIGGLQGLVLARKSTTVIERSRISGMQEGGVSCQLGSAPVLKDNIIENCGPFGVFNSQFAQPTVTGNVVTGCGTGLALGQLATPIEGNTLKGNKVGVLLTSCGKELTVRGNRALDNEVGIVCQQFSSPLVENNTIKGNKQGLVCFMASSPLIRNNLVSANDEGISCIQICDPSITANDIQGNKKGIYLDLSSYAVINGNNIYDNAVQLELGNMSSDWERRVGAKPVRGSQAQNATRADRGKEVRRYVEDSANVMGYVDATGNWWGEAATKEMERKGADANIEGFIDYYDVPMRTYEGYEGEYVQDRIKYEGWKSSRIKGAGL